MYIVYAICIVSEQRTEARAGELYVHKAQQYISCLHFLFASIHTYIHTYIQTNIHTGTLAQTADGRGVPIGAEYARAL